jgi:hypothetical protein
VCCESERALASIVPNGATYSVGSLICRHAFRAVIAGAKLALSYSDAGTIYGKKSLPSWEMLVLTNVCLRQKNTFT